MGQEYSLGVTHPIYVEYCFRGTNIVYLGNKNIASEEPISSTRVTRILHPENTSRHLGEQEYCIPGTNLVYSGNKEYCLGGTTLITHKEQKYSVHGTNIIYTWNTKIIPEEQISRTQGTKK
jgi:hypothetical protein